MIKMERLMKNLTAIGEIGRTENGGITRLAFSDEYFEALYKLKDLAESRGYQTNIDSFGNLLITYNPKGFKTYIMMGSHLDTVREGGLYDGALGVFSALEVLDSIKDHNIPLHHGIKLACFNAEEGSAMGGIFGSKVMCGKIDYENETLLENLKHYGLTLNDLRESSVKLNDISAYVELHIEQGGILDREKLDIGVVKGIVGIQDYDLILKGTANHGGTTPMGLRDDPIRNLPSVIQTLYDLAKKYKDPFVMTVGDIKVFPGMSNIIPEKVTITVEARDLEQDNIHLFFEDVENYLSQSSFKYEFIKKDGSPSVLLDKNIIQTIEEATKSKEYKYKIMSSGAGHDAETMSHFVPAGMIFVPSIDGISHSSKEYTTMEQIQKGANVLLESILRLDKSLK